MGDGVSCAGLGVMPGAHLLGSIPCMEGSSSSARGVSTTVESGDPGKEVAASVTLANLLPSASSALTQSVEGVYMGEGVPPVPVKLAARIRRGEYIEMGELLPEFWQEVKEETGKEARPRRTRKVSDILTWTQCYASYVVVRVSQSPELVAELMAYQTTILRVSQDFAGLAWVRYDQAYRRQAALTGHTKWSVINSTVY